MSVTMTRADGVTALTWTSSPQSPYPPICQIFKSLCCNPLCCSVSQRLRRIQGSSQSVLGALQILIGCMYIALGAILYGPDNGPGWQMRMDAFFPFWIGGLFILFGAVNIWSEKRPSPCLIILSVVLSIVGVAMAMAAIGFSGINIGGSWIWVDCTGNDDSYGQPYPTPSAEKRSMWDKCLEVKNLTMKLLVSINAVLIALAILELCITISSAVLGIKALCSRDKREDRSPDDLEYCKSPAILQQK
ncbi:transmembrane protein 176A-like [Halichoeres trimaculatus]|uniref:transmembrane protein 176A-like n=1 Tax=Halichoeres trimaculatus TaxID=147232 RepID=UPI003D9E0964